MYNLKLENKKALQKSDRSLDTIQRSYKLSRINNDVKSHKIKKSKSSGLFDDIKPCPTTRGIANYCFYQ